MESWQVLVIMLAICASYRLHVRTVIMPVKAQIEASYKTAILGFTWLKYKLIHLKKENTQLKYSTILC
jgi:hypothetical protein